MSLDQFSLIINILNTTILALLFIYLKFGIEKQLKKYEYFIGDANDLNTKMHDRLVEITDLVNKMQPIPDTLRKRLLFNSARLKKHDSSISSNIAELLKIWNEAFYEPVEEGAIKIDGRTEKQEKCLELITVIEGKIDKLVKL